jgi:SAM-dependent methyltransferase
MSRPPTADPLSRSPHDSWAPYYERVMELTYGELYARLTTCALAEIRGRLPRGRPIVDFGAGCGRLAIPLAAEGYRVTAVEPSRPMLDVLRARRRAMRPRSAIARLGTVGGRMEETVLPRKQDMALCVFTVISYLLHPTALFEAFASAASALAPGGQFLIDVPDGSLFSSSEHENAWMIRSVEMEPLESRRYAYREETTLRTPGGRVTYRDRFMLRRWSVAEVTDALGRAGFTRVEDVTDSFPELGALYLLARLG